MHVGVKDCTSHWHIIQYLS
eukprot:gene20257-26299_t